MGDEDGRESTTSDAHIIIDVGCDTCKAGFSAETAPSVVFPCVVGHPRGVCERGDVCEVCEGEHYVGAEAEANRRTSNLTYPMLTVQKYRKLSHWGDIERVFHHMFRELDVVPAHRSVLLTEPPLSPKAVRERLAETMFKSFQVGALYIAPPAVLALYGIGCATGVVVDCGYCFSHAMPVYEGSLIADAVSRLSIGGDDLGEYMIKIFSERGWTVLGAAEREISRRIKEQYGYVALDFEEEMLAAATSSGIEQTFKLCDGEEYVIGTERFRCAEVLYQPSLMGVSSPGIHEVTYNAIMKCDGSIREELYQHVVLCGGSSLFPGMRERMEKELRAMVPATVSVAVLSPPERLHLTWAGGAALSTHPHGISWIQRSDYDEHGAACMHR